MHPELHAISQQPGVRAALAGDLHLSASVDRAHLIGLVERGVLPRGRVLPVLACIEELVSADFAPLRGRPAPRGWYLMYESYLIEQLGPDAGGALQLGRSRNDLTATVQRMRMRGPYLDLLERSVRLTRALHNRAVDHADVVMPAFTHGQPAVPITYGHWLAGCAVALTADIDALVAAGHELDLCPLGAGAIGGTSVPVDGDRSAWLLGFTGACPNSVEAVAGRDWALRITAAATVLGVLLGRMATDLIAWTGVETFLELPDDLTGGSSMMPQKRNVFGLEHVLGKSSAALGALVTGVTAAHGTPFTNSIAVHAEAMRPVADALGQVGDALTLLRLVIRAARPRREVMIRRAEAAHTAATEAATWLALARGRGFRDAHGEVRNAVAEATANGESLADVMGRRDPGACGARLDVSAVARAAAYGGGPGGDSLTACLGEVSARHREHVRALRDRRVRWSDVPPRLDRAATEMARSHDRARQEAS